MFTETQWKSIIQDMSDKQLSDLHEMIEKEQIERENEEDDDSLDDEESDADDEDSLEDSADDNDDEEDDVIPHSPPVPVDTDDI